MTQKLARYSSPIQRYKKNMARIVWNARSSVFDDYGKQYVKDTFRHFGKEWHNIIADEYPKVVTEYLTDNSDTGLDNSKYLEWRKYTQDYEDEAEKRGIFFDPDIIENYLINHHNWPNGNPSTSV